MLGLRAVSLSLGLIISSVSTSASEKDIFQGLAGQLMESFNSKDDAKLRRVLSRAMSEAFPSDQASELFGSMKKEHGLMVKLGATRFEAANRAVVPIVFERGMLDAKIVVDAASRIDGLFFMAHRPDIAAPSKHETPISLPFTGKWLVFWGGDTPDVNAHHKLPNQRFAFDLIGVGEDGKTQKGQGTANEDYYAFGREILAPADGTVTDVIDGVRDNVPGSMNQYSALGNSVFIEHRPYEVSILAHLKLRSIRVKPGDKVKRGQVLGLCGNSGNSSEPHLHFHLQNTPVIQDGTGIKILFDRLQVGQQPSIKKAYSPVKGETVSQPTAAFQ